MKSSFSASTVMSGKFRLVSGKCQGILFCQVCMNPDSVTALNSESNGSPLQLLVRRFSRFVYSLYPAWSKRDLIPVVIRSIASK